MINSYYDWNGFSDPSGKLSFDGKAILHAQGVDFTGGTSYKINKEEFELMEELGRGQYGTVKKVFHKPTNVVMAMKVLQIMDEMIEWIIVWINNKVIIKMHVSLSITLK